MKYNIVSINDTNSARFSNLIPCRMENIAINKFD